MTDFSNEMDVPHTLPWRCIGASVRPIIVTTTNASRSKRIPTAYSSHPGTSSRRIASGPAGGYTSVVLRRDDIPLVAQAYFAAARDTLNATRVGNRGAIVAEKDLMRQKWRGHRDDNRPVEERDRGRGGRSDVHDVVRGTTAAAAQIRPQIDALERVDVVCAAYGARGQRLGTTLLSAPSLILLVLLVLMAYVGYNPTGPSQNVLLFFRPLRVGPR